MIETIEHGPVRELRLARPPANALSPELLAEICDEVDRAPVDGARAVVLSGAEGLFTGGLDVPLMLSLGRDEMIDAIGRFFGAMSALAFSRIPVAAAITGHSPAGGAVLSIFCDWRVMAEGPYKIGFNEVRIGIPMPSTIAETLARIVGRRQAEILCQTGRMMESEEARAIGLVDELAPVGDVVGRAVAWCAELAELPPHALHETRRTVRRDLFEIIDRSRTADVETLVDEWFRPEVQGPLQALAKQLTGG